MQKHIPKLIIENNNSKSELTEQKAIEAEISNYYKDLFSKKDISDRNIEDFLGPEASNSCPKLSNKQKEKTEGLMSWPCGRQHSWRARRFLLWGI